MHAKQLLYHFSHAPKPLLCSWFHCSSLISVNEGLDCAALEDWVKSLGNCVGQSLNPFTDSSPYPRSRSLELDSKCGSGSERGICFRPGQVILNPMSRSH
jgi:hypothetical protein